MSFWKTFGFHSVSAIDNILDSGNFTLEQLMDEEDILQETKAQNKKLIDFIVEENTLKKLLSYVADEPAPDEQDQRRRFKYPFIACEVLASEVWAICDAIYAHPALLDKLYSFLEKDDPLNPLLTSYSCRVASVLLVKKLPETINYLKEKKNIISLFLKHLGNATVMDLLLKIIAAQDPLADNPTQTLDWLCTTELIPSLVKRMDQRAQGNTEEVIENAAQALVDIIAASSQLQKSPLIDQLESPDIVRTLLDAMLGNANSISLLHGLSVLNQLVMRYAQRTSEGSDEPAFIKLLIDNTNKLAAFLQSQTSGKLESNAVVYHSSVGDIAPLGFHRLRLIEFFGSMVATNLESVHTALINNGVFNKCFDLFFQYPWNNFLHQSIFMMLVAIFQSKHEKLQIALLTECRLLNRIVDAVKENEEELKKEHGLRRGYMGHVTKISELLIETSKERDAQLAKILNENTAWQEYVNGQLKDTQVKQQVAIEYLQHQQALHQTQMQQDHNNEEAEQDEEVVEDRIDTTVEEDA